MANHDKSGQKWTVEEENMLYHLKIANKTHAEIASIMNKEIGKREYNENVIHKKWTSTDWKDVVKRIGDTQAELNILKEREFEKQKVIESTLTNQERLIKREHARTELIIDSLKSSIYRLPKPKSSDLNYSPKWKNKYREEHVGLLLSDLHIGESFTMEDTGGLSEFNVEIFHQRLDILKHSLLEICERHRHVCDLPHLHIFCLGDIVAGMDDVGAWSAHYIDQDIYDQMMEGVHSLRDVIAMWSRAFNKVTFYGIFGNHGRVARKGKAKESTNWDRICYEIIRLSMSEYENIDWKIPRSWWLMEKIQNHNFYMTHGSGIQSSMGIPFYGIERAERNINGIMKEKPDYFLLGHFHSPAEIQTNSSRILVNGAFSGGDMYSLKELRRQCKAEQKLFGIHQKKGITWVYSLRLN